MEPDGTPVATTRQMVKGRVQQKGRQCVRVAEIEVGGDGLDAQERELITFQPPGSRSNHSRQVWWPSMEPPCPVSRWGRPCVAYCVYFCSNGVPCHIVLLQAHHSRTYRVCCRKSDGGGKGVWWRQISCFTGHDGNCDHENKLGLVGKVTSEVRTSATRNQAAHLRAPS